MQIWDRKSQAQDAERVNHNTNTALFYRTVCCPQGKKKFRHTKYWVWWVTTWLSNSNLFIYLLDVFSFFFFYSHLSETLFLNLSKATRFGVILLVQCQCLVPTTGISSRHTRWAALPGWDPQEFNVAAIKSCVQSLRQLRQMKRRDC